MLRNALMVSLVAFGLASAVPASAQAQRENAADPDALRSLVTTGRVYGLGIVTGPDTPAYPGRSYEIDVVSATANGGPMGSNRLTGHDDHVRLSNGVGTQIDGLAHIGIDGVHYGGVTADEVFDPDGVRVFGLHELEPFVTRGVLLDIAALEGRDVLAADHAITPEDIDAALEAQSLSLQSGDVVLLHTGWLETAGDDGERYMASSPGLSVAGAEHLAAFGVRAVGADTWGVEIVPAETEGEVFPVHQVLLARNGIYLLENIRTEALARDAVGEFLFVLGIPRLQGAVQAVINPVAID